MLNGSYEISKLLHSHTDVNSTFLSNESIKNITLIKLEDYKLDASQFLEFSYNYNNFHFVIIYTFLTIIICTVIICIIIKCKKSQKKAKIKNIPIIVEDIIYNEISDNNSS